MECLSLRRFGNKPNAVCKQSSRDSVHATSDNPFRGFMHISFHVSVLIVVIVSACCSLYIASPSLLVLACSVCIDVCIYVPHVVMSFFVYVSVCSSLSLFTYSVFLIVLFICFVSVMTVVFWKFTFLCRIFIMLLFLHQFTCCLCSC